MSEAPDERLWVRRLRWRLRGAWMWPGFAACTALGAIVLSTVPFSGEGLDPVGAFLLAGFLNLGILAMAGPLVGWAWQRRRPRLPPEVARDRAASGLMVLLLAGMAVAGVVNRGDVADAQDDVRRAKVAASEWVLNQAGPPFVENHTQVDVWSPGGELHRACVPGSDDRRALCLLVDTSEGIPTVRRDPDQRPNSVIAGPDNPGRRAG